MRITRIAAKSEGQKKRVAAYCRVSTLKSEQEESFFVQESYYRGFIEGNPDWIFAGVYGDIGISALKADTRPQFLKMIEDAESGAIDLILCKSISRFSRNLVDCIRYTGRLRDHDVYVRFEKEKITTSDPTADLIFSLLSAVAQNESQSISDNVRWAHRERIRRGEYNIGNNRILGFDAVNGKPVPNDDASVIKEIFERFISGEGYTAIADRLNLQGRKTLRGKEFRPETIRAIVCNEVYVGDRLLQKQPPTELLTKRPDPNREYESYYITNGHRGIIDRETWQAAKAVIERRAEERRAGVKRCGREHHVFYGKLFCGYCGAPLTRRTFRSGMDGGEPRNYKAWLCRGKQSGCCAKSLQEARLEEAIRSALGVESFDGQAFAAAVERAEVYSDRIIIKMIDSKLVAEPEVKEVLLTKKRQRSGVNADKGAAAR